MRCRQFCKHSRCTYVQKSFIYVLVDIRTNLPFYLGETVHPLRRLKEHVRSAYYLFDTDKPEYAKLSYIRSIVDDGLYPQMIILDTVESDCRMEVCDIEREYATLLWQNGIEVITGGFDEHGYPVRLLVEQIDRHVKDFATLREMFLYG